MIPSLYRISTLKTLLLSLTLAIASLTVTAHAQQGSATENDDVYVIAGQSNATRLFNNSGLQTALRRDGRRVNVVTTSAVGTGFTSIAGRDWNLSSRGELYDGLVNQINSFEGRRDVKSVIWVQGENETSGTAVAQQYEGRLRAFINGLRRDTGITNLHVIVVQLSRRIPAARSRGTRWSIVRRAQAAIAREMNNVDLLRVDGVIRAEGIDVDDPRALKAFLADGIHWNARTAVLIGQRVLRTSGRNR